MESNIYGFDKQYTITPDGDVFAISKYDKKQIYPSITTRGYYSVSFRRHGKTVGKLVHRLVAMAFVPGYKVGKQINHKNGMKLDNRAENLEWVTPKENSHHSRVTGLYDNRGRKHSMSKLTEADVIAIRATANIGIPNYVTIGKAYGVNKTCIRKIVTRETWRHI